LVVLRDITDRMCHTRTMAKTRKTKENTAPRLVGYVRVSTEEQRDEGVSLAAQVERLEAYAVAHGFALAAIERDEGVSGKVAPVKRPGLSAALSRVRSGEAEGIVALKLDRLSRSTRDVLDLADDAQRGDWRLVSVSEALDTGSATGKFTLTILAALAQLEREQISERTTAALAHIGREGRVRSRFAPFGHRLANGSPTAEQGGERAHLVEDEGEQRILATMKRYRKRGYGARKIAGALNARGVENPRTGQAWHYGTVAAILRTADKRAALTA